MSEFLDIAGLQRYHEKAEAAFGNKIETIKVNDTTLTPDAQKAVNVKTPYTDMGEDSETGGTYYSMTDNNGNTFYRFVTSANGYKVGLGTGYAGGGITKELVDKNYVDTYGSKIDKIKVNGTEQTITNKEVDLTIPVMYTDNVGGFTITDPTTNREVMFEYISSDKTLGYAVDGLQSFEGLSLASTDYVSANTATNKFTYQEPKQEEETLTCTPSLNEDACIKSGGTYDEASDPKCKCIH